MEVRMDRKVKLLLWSVFVAVMVAVGLGYAGYDVKPYLDELPSAAMLAVGLGVAGYFIRRAEVRWEKERALERVNSNRFYHEGAKVYALYDTNGVNITHAADAVIEKIKFGLVVLRLNDGPAWPLTVQEFDAMHVIMHDER